MTHFVMTHFVAYCDGLFWSALNGWGNLVNSTVYSHEQIQDKGILPVGARWIDISIATFSEPKEEPLHYWNDSEWKEM